MSLITACHELDELGGGRRLLTAHLQPIAYRENGVLRAIARDWQQGDPSRPHVVTSAPFTCSIAPDGARRIHPTRDPAKYLELGRPHVKVGGSWQAPSFGEATRTGNRLRWDNGQAALIVEHSGHALKLGLLLKGGYVPEDGQIAFPVDLIGLSRQGGQILDADQVVGTLRAPTVEDLDNPADARPIAVSFPMVGGQRVALLQLPDLSGMSRPLVDPTYTSQPDATAGKDTYLRSDQATTNFGTATSIIIDAAGVVRRGLVEFDLSSITAGATINSATLTLWVSAFQSGDQTVAAHRILSGNSGWTESGATWNTKDGSNAWAGSAGCSTSATDFSATQAGSASIPNATASGTQLDLTLDTAEVAAMLAANYGFVLVPSTTSAALLASSDHATAGLRPQLVIDWTAPGGATTRPRALLTLGVGS